LSRVPNVIVLGRFNVFVGANASGKSNFIELFRFIDNVRTHDLEQAIALEGGVEYFRNIGIGATRNFELELASDRKFPLVSRKPGPGEMQDLLGLKVNQTKYHMCVAFGKGGKGFRIVKDSMQFSGQLDALEDRGGDRLAVARRLGPGRIKVMVVDGQPCTEITSKEFSGGFEGTLLDQFRGRGWRTIPLLSMLSFMPLPPFEYVLDDFEVYDFDLKLAKSAVPLTGTTALDEDGGNLAIVLSNILRSNRKKTKLFNLVKPLLPFIADVKTVRFSDKSRFFRLQETYSEDEYLPASLLSDGTIDLIAMIVALYFEDKDAVLFEEPDRNIHPRLIVRLVDMMKDVSRNRQVIMTTHNPEVVKHAGLKNLYLVSRDNRGFSTIHKPADSRRVRAFLKDELGVEDLHTQDLLGM